MKNFTLLFVLLLPFFGFSQTLEQSLYWGQVINITLPTTQNQTYSSISLHEQSVVVVPQGVNLTITGQVQGGKIIFLGNNVVKIHGDVNGNGKIEMGTYSSLEILGSINNAPDLTFLGFDIIKVQNIHAGTLRLNGNTCFRVQNQISANINFIGTGTNNNVNYNVPASWNFSISSPNISFSNNTDSQCSAFTACTPPANTQAFGDNEWNGYVYTYTGNNTDFNTATYIGTLKEDKIFERNVEAGAVDGRVGSRNIPCVTPPSEKFMVRYKMKLTITEAAKYNFTVTGDDGFRLFVDNLTTPLVNGWTDNKSTGAGLKDLTVGTHDLILEYYEGPGNSELIFTYGKIAGDFQNYAFGINEWKAYGFSACNQTDYNLTLDSNTYAGYYTQSTLDSELIWNQNGSPSKTIATNVWNGAPVHNYNYTLSYRRQGFKCGTYQLKMDKWDDAAEVYIYDSNNVATKVWQYNGYSGGINTSNQGLKNVG